MFAIVIALGGCAIPEMESFRAPSADALFRPLSVSNYKEKVLPPVAQADLVDAGGRCAGAIVATDGNQPGQPDVSPQAAVPVIPSAVSLDMTECDVVKRAGVAERVDIGRNERSERTVTLTYTAGERPGIYNFTDGRLKSMERAPEPVKPARATKPPKRPAKPRQTATVN